MEGYTRAQLQQLCKEYNKTAATKVNCNSANKVLYNTLFPRAPEIAVDEEVLQQLEQLNELQLPEYCKQHEKICQNKELWEKLFARVFRDLYPIFSSVEHPDIEKSKHRVFIPWKNIYTQMVEISRFPILLRVIESVINNEEEPIDKWNRRELQQYELISIILAQISNFYIVMLAKDESPLLELVPIRPDRWRAVLTQSLSRILFERYYDVRDKLSAAKALTNPQLRDAATRALMAGRSDIFKLLLQDPGFDLGKWLGSQLSRIVHSGNAEFLELSRQYSAAPIVFSDYHLRDAVNAQHKNIVRYIIEHTPSGNITSETYNWALAMMKNLDVEFLEFFMAHHEISQKYAAAILAHNPTIPIYEFLRDHTAASQNALLGGAVRSGEEELIKFVLSNLQQDVEKDFLFENFLWLSLKTLKLLLSDPRIDPSTNVDIISSMLKQKSQKKKAQILLQDKRFVQALDPEKVKALKKYHSL